MDDRTPEQVAADAAMDSAVAARSAAFPGTDPSEYLTSWILVAAVDRLEGGGTKYVVTESGGHLPPHVSRGLLEIGLDIVQEATAGPDPEDD